MSAHEMGYRAYLKRGLNARNPYRGIDKQKSDQWQAGFKKAYREHFQLDPST